MSILDRNNFCRLHNRLCTVYRNYVHCNTIFLRLQVAAAMACTRRTPPELRRAQHERTGQLHSDAKRKATNCTNAWGLCGNVFALEIQLRAR